MNNSSHFSVGNLSVFLGPMFSGKSTTLLHKIIDFISKELYIIVFKPEMDKNRLCEEINCTISTHNKLKFSTETTYDYEKFEIYYFNGEKNLIEETIKKKPNIIIFEEYHLIYNIFNDIELYLKKIINLNINILIISIDYWHTGEPVECIWKILKDYQAKDIQKRGKCYNCKEPNSTIFTFKNNNISSNNNELIEIGKEDIYTPLCKKCFYSLKK